MSFEIQGFDEFEAELYKLAREKFPRETKKFVRQLGNEVRREARRITPKGKTGNLRKGWRLGRSYKRGASYWIVVKNTAPHAHLVEQGHRMVDWHSGREVGTVPGSGKFKRVLEGFEARLPARVREWLEKMVWEFKL